MATTITTLMFVKGCARTAGFANPIHDAVARRAATTWRTDPAGENGSGAGSNPGRWDWSADWQFLNVSRESNFAPDSFF
jgi:hypothetical protein